MSPTLQLAIDQITFARNYTLKLLDTIPLADWFRMPAAGVSHVAWQVGHLAMAQYRLALERIRGRLPGDERLISELFLMQFGRESVPEPDPSKGPSAEEIRHSFDAVHRQVLYELPSLAEDELNEPPLRPHPLFTTKVGGLFWCAQHEMLHAGQLGLLRRQLGQAPLW
jgi:uncharacterized damage-inducible protein DinB